MSAGQEIEEPAGQAGTLAARLPGSRVCGSGWQTGRCRSPVLSCRRQEADLRADRGRRSCLAVLEAVLIFPALSEVTLRSSRGLGSVLRSSEDDRFPASGI